MDLYNQAKPVKPFLFYHETTGRISTFESVAFPGWFIASSETRQPIFLTSELGNVYNIGFQLDFKVWTQPRGSNLVLSFLALSVFVCIISVSFLSVLRGGLEPVLILFYKWRRSNDSMETKE